MDDIPLALLICALIFLIILSALFSGSETGLLTLNRYRLKHLVRSGHPGAKRAQQLLDRPDRLIGLILLGNNFTNILASSLATIIALRLMGEAGIAVAAGLLTLVILIFAEVTPKTLATLYPERLAFPASWVYTPMLKLLYPIVWTINLISNNLLRLIGIDVNAEQPSLLTKEEIRTVVLEAGTMIPGRRKRMLLNILDLERVTVEDIMIARNDVIGIDLNDDWADVVNQLADCQYTKLPLFRGSLDETVGFIHSRDILQLLRRERFNEADLLALAHEPTYVPEGTPLPKQLLNFQRDKQRVGFVINEYGDVQGLVALQDILEEIVGEFTSNPSTKLKEVRTQSDGTLLVDGGAHIRDLNRLLSWSLPTSGPKTLNGLILEYLESIPESGTSLLLSGYPVEIVQTQGNVIKIVKIHPQLPRTE